MEKPDLFEYSDFRQYLSDLFNWRHEQDVKFNKAYICRILGLENSRSYFQDIINGKFLSIPKVPLMAEAFGLSKEETRYFRILVNYNQSFDSAEERELFFGQLVALKRASGREVDLTQYEFYSKWYHSVIRLTLDIVDATETDVDLIRKQLIPDISAKEIRESLKLLKKLNLVFVDENGYLKPSETIIRTPHYCRDEAVIRYQMQVLEQAQHVYPPKSSAGLNKRTITKMLTFSAEGNRLVEAAIDRFSNEINTIVAEDKDEPDRIYQMLVTLFPYSKGKKRQTGKAGSL